MKTNEYYCFNEKGRTLLPTNSELNEIREKGIKPIIFIDSCVCLHISKLIDHKKNAREINKHRIIRLKEYISKHKIEINPMFGLMELAQKNNEFDERKFWDLYERIDFFKKIPKKNLSTYRYNFKTEYFSLNEPKLKEHTPFYGFESFFLNTYCSLLKIRKLSQNGLSKKYAEKNITEFIDWMLNSLGIMLGIEYKLAMNVFGGKTEFRKMIWLEGKESLIQKKLIGTAWDITHARFCSNNINLSKKLGENLSAYFLTSDSNLFELLSEFSLTGILDAGEIGSTSMINTNFNLPHFDKTFIDKNNIKMLELMTERFNKEIIYEKNKVVNLILNLEKENNVA